MKNKLLILFIPTIAIIGLATIFFFNQKKEISNQAVDIRGVSDIDTRTSQNELWDKALINFQAESNRYSSQGIIQGNLSRLGTNFSFTIEFQASIDNQNSDIRFFSQDQEVFLKSFNSELYLAQDSTLTNWYKLDLSQNINSSQNEFNLNGLTELVELGNDLDNLKPTYISSLECEDQVCQSYEVEINNQLAEFIIDESGQKIKEIRLKPDGNYVSINFFSSDEVVNEPENITILNQSESQEIAQESIALVIRNSILNN